MKTIKELETQIIELQKELETLKNPPSYKRWRAEEGDLYYYVSFNKSISYAPERQDNLDNGNYDFGNYYKTKEEAEQARDKQLAIIRINDRIMELNEGWVPKVNTSDDNYYIYYSSYSGYLVDKDNYITYFVDKILKYIKSIDIAEQIIIEMKYDLDLIFNIK